MTAPGPRARHLCWLMRRSVQAHLDGVLTAPTAGQVSAHLTTCWHCSRAAQMYQAIKAALHRRQSSVAEPVTRLREFCQTLLDDAHD